jgi:ATP-binding cassette subfamily B protein
LTRSIRYLGRYRWQAIIPYLFLVVATAAQLMVPRMLGNIIDAVTQGTIANAIVPRMDTIPAGILDQILEGLELTEAQLIFNAENAERLLIASAVAILIFAVVRGVFAFLQTFTAERNSQSVAFDMRNELFAKIQGLSFSYHDRNQTGQLMIRATDDVEKVRLFIGQGLLMAVGAIILLSKWAHFFLKFKNDWIKSIMSCKKTCLGSKLSKPSPGRKARKKNLMVLLMILWTSKSILHDLSAFYFLS